MMGFVTDKGSLRPDGLYYAGRRAGEPPSDVITAFPVGKVLPIPGRTAMGEYIEEAGTVRSFLAAAPNSQARAR